jgi:hypothetical protein
MAHGGYGKRRVAERKPPVGRRSTGLGVDKKPKQKPKSVSIKNQIRSIDRMLRKVLLLTSFFHFQLGFFSPLISSLFNTRNFHFK